MNIDCSVRNIHCSMQDISLRRYGVICILQSILFRLDLFSVKALLACGDDRWG